MTRRTILLTLGWILPGLGLASLGAAADRNQWTPIGPDLSTVRALAVTPSGAAYAGTTQRGVFRSADGGARWSIPSPIPGQFVRELAIDPGNPRGVYALTETSLFYSRNGGAWQVLRRSNLFGSYLAFAVSPSEPSHLYLYEGSLQVSHDRGRSWASLSPPWNDLLVLKVHPRDPDILFAGVFDSRVWKSTDGGRSWRGNQWIGPSQGFISVTSLAFDPGNPDVMYAGTNSNGIWKSIDAGETWRPVFTVSGFEDLVLALAIDPSQGRRIYGAVNRPADDGPTTGEIWRSEDAGATWNRVLTLRNAALSLAVDPGNPRNVYAGFERQGVLKSTDHGATWSPARRGLQAYTVSDVAVDPNRPGSIWIAAPEGSAYFEDRHSGYVYPGLLHTTDGGRSWVSLDRELDDTFYPQRIVLDPVRSERLWTFSDGEFYRSVDGGRSWQFIEPLRQIRASAFVIDPSDPDRIFLAGSRRVGFEYSYDIPIVWRSLDGGETWEELDSGFDLGRQDRAREGRMTGLALSPVRPETVYAGGTFGFFRSRNSGDTWARISADVPQPCGTSSLVVDPFAPSTLYAIDCNEGHPVFKSTDNGANWKPTALALPGGISILWDLIADPRRPGTIYAAGDAGVFVTDDRGAHWRPLNTGLPAGFRVFTLAADPRTGRIYAGTGGAGLFVLTRR